MSVEVVEKVTFKGFDGISLAGHLYRPPVSGNSPAIIMAPGFGGNKEHSVDKFASVFSSSGFVVLAFDNRNFGESAGEPRQEADPVMQRRDYRDALTYLMTVPGVDGERIGLWGSSYSGGHVIEVAALDRRVRCVVSQVPTISGYGQAVRRTPPSQMLESSRRFDADRIARYAGKSGATVKLVSDDPSESCVFSGERAFRHYYKPGWRNEITLKSLEFARENEPGIYITRVSPTPLLMIVADADTVTPTDMALAAYQTALEPKFLELIPGGHFAPYLEEFERSTAASVKFFQKFLHR